MSEWRGKSNHLAVIHPEGSIREQVEVRDGGATVKQLCDCAGFTKLHLLPYLGARTRVFAVSALAQLTCASNANPWIVLPA